MSETFLVPVFLIFNEQDKKCQEQGLDPTTPTLRLTEEPFSKCVSAYYLIPPPKKKRGELSC